MSGTLGLFAGTLGFNSSQLSPPAAGGGDIPDGFVAVTQDGEQVTQDGEPVYVAAE